MAYIASFSFGVDSSLWSFLWSDVKFLLFGVSFEKMGDGLKNFFLKM